ncbi:MAG: hypothetical protein K8F25_02255, partial [Fimbriimonadaceae bacterium]|nr:hypothetical protein [Alphaproteobacteria bacterium]
LQILLNFGDVEPARHSPMIFQIDDGPSFRFDPEDGYEQVAADYKLTDPAQASLMIDAMSSGQALYITFVSPKLRETGLAFSLKGAPASLQRMSGHSSD